jgi:hypothetical protein
MQRDLVGVEDEIDDLQPAAAGTRGDVDREHAGEQASP